MDFEWSHSSISDYMNFSSLESLWKVFHSTISLILKWIPIIILDPSLNSFSLATNSSQRARRWFYFFHSEGKMYWIEYNLECFHLQKEHHLIYHHHWYFVSWHHTFLTLLLISWAHLGSLFSSSLISYWQHS